MAANVILCCVHQTVLLSDYAHSCTHVEVHVEGRTEKIYLHPRVGTNKAIKKKIKNHKIA